MKRKILRWRDRKFVIPLRKALKSGISIERLSVSLALGITVGLIPLYGLTTILVALIALSLRLNFVAMQVAHYVVHPIQIALLIPFFKIGDILLKSQDFSFTIHQYLHLLRTDFWGAMHELWLLNLSAVGVWLLISVPLFIGLYYSFQFALRKYIPALVRVPVRNR